MDEVRDFLAEVKQLLPSGDIPEYVFRMVEIVSDAEKAIAESYERTHLAEVTIEQSKETIARLEDENARLRDVNIRALLNQSSEETEEVKEEKVDVENGEKIKSLEEVIKEGVE